MNLTVLILCVTVSCVYMLPFRSKLDENRKLHIPPTGRPQYLPNQVTLSTVAPSTTEKSNGTKFAVSNIVDVKENGCPTGYFRDPVGNCRKAEN